MSEIKEEVATRGNAINTGILTDVVVDDNKGEAGAGGNGSEETLTPEQIEAKAKADKEAKNTAGKGKEAEAGKEVEVTDEQLQKLLESRGIKGFTNLEELKTKITPKEELSPEQIKAAETAKDLAAQEVYIKAGGTIEGYAAIKALANATDVKEVSKAAITRELKAANFSDAEIEAVIADRYQIALDNIKQEDEETPEEFADRKAKLEKYAKFAAEKFEARGKREQEQAKNTLSQLHKAIETSTLEKQALEKEELEITSKVDEISKTASRKLTVDLGKDEQGAQRPPFEYNYTEEEIAEVADELKDVDKRNNILFTPEGTLKVDALFDMQLKNKRLEKIIATAFSDGETVSVKKFRSIYPGSANEIGLGNPMQRRSAGTEEVASAGKTQRVNP